MSEENDYTPKSPMSRVCDLLGNKWAAPVLYSLSVERDHSLRFTEIGKRTCCSRKMLATTLQKLTKAQLIDRKASAEEMSRVDYSLTELGLSLMPTLFSLASWARNYYKMIDEPDIKRLKGMDNRHIP